MRMAAPHITKLEVEHQMKDKMVQIKKIKEDLVTLLLDHLSFGQAFRQLTNNNQKPFDSIYNFKGFIV